MKKLKIILAQHKKTQDIDYVITDNPVAALWASKIKHLRGVEVDPIETSGFIFGSLESYHREFCNMSGTPYVELDYDLQGDLNYLHELYEKNHKRLSISKDPQFLYAFHHAIHDKEIKTRKETKHYVGWGVKEGPLTTMYKCNEFYSDHLEKNNLYLPWSELGKTPLAYYRNKEPSRLDRFIELGKPHVTLRPRFMICRRKESVKQFDDGFKNWFATLSQGWLAHYALDQWREQDEFSGVLLATPADGSIDVDIILKQFPKIKSVQLI